MSSPSPSGETRVLPARPKVHTVRRLRFVVTAGPDVGKESVSDAAEFAIGTAEGNQLVLTDGAVSRHHCVVAARPAGFLLRDLGSKNGTFLAGIRIEAAYLKPDSALSLGETTLRIESLDEEIREPLSEEDRWGRALGRSPAMRRIFALLPRLAASDSSLLLEGETGTGKGLLADAIHQASPRARGPFVVLDCASIPPTLIESELFGHEKGAFTGAHTARRGCFEAARGGTVFLDEIGELPLDMQPKLLRALEERMIKRVGSTEPVRLDVRIIAATNRDLRREVNRGAFRSDLYYRLNTVRLRVPPLRERQEDIPLLVAHFYSQFVGDGDPEPPAELVATMLRHEWPGNVRELRSAVERVVLLGDPASWQEADDSSGAVESSPPAASAGSAGSVAAVAEAAAAAVDADDPALSFRAAKESAMSAWERRYVRDLIRRHDGNLSRAARASRMDRNHLRELLLRHGVPIRED